VSRLLAALLLLSCAGPASAYCEGGRYPNVTVQEEIPEADFIVIGTVTNRRIVVDTVEDPEGYEAELFQVEIEDVIRGTPPDHAMKPYLTIYEENASSRFGMEVGVRYLLFVSASADGYYINSCGNSGVLSESADILDVVGRTAGPPQD
jgi:hypothetical protein